MARSSLQWLLFVTAIISGAALGVFALRSMVWAAVCVALCALAASFLPGTRTARNTALTLLTGCICLLVGEGLADHGQTSAGTGARFEPQPLFVADPALGWVPRPSSTIHAVRAEGGSVIYDAIYTIGADGYRVTPASRADGDTVLFLGDSFMFGDGLADSQTLPQRFAIHTENRFHVVNLGVSAYGPHQVLRQIETGVIDRAVGGSKVRAAFLYFVDDQLPRAGGDKPAEWWWQMAPQYEATPGGPRLVGTAAEAWAHRGPVERALYEATNASEIASLVRHFARVHPELELSEALIRQIRLALHERYGVELVVLYWSTDPLKIFPTVVSGMMERAGVPMVFVPDLLRDTGLTTKTAVIPHDGHPNGSLNDVIADDLARHLEP